LSSQHGACENKTAKSGDRKDNNGINKH
jgi:hypothetical protein